jgi:hypothetical protein
MAKKSLRFKKAGIPKMFGTGDQPYRGFLLRESFLAAANFAQIGEKWRKREGRKVAADARLTNTKTEQTLAVIM